MQFEIEGLEALNRRLERLAQCEGLEQGLAQAGELVRSDAAANCPHDTGRLQESITSKMENQNTAVIGTNVKYGLYVEFGTGVKGNQSVGHTSKKQWTYYSDKLGRFVTTSGQQAHPFLVPALKNNTGQIIQIIKNNIAGDRL